MVCNNDINLVCSDDDILFKIKNCLNKYNYKKLQYYPTNKARYFGHELLILRQYILKDKINLFRSSAFKNMYDKLILKDDINLYRLYKIFYRCEKISFKTMNIYFTENEINKLLENEIFYSNDSGFHSNYRFVPLLDKLIMCSPKNKNNTPDYVHIGPDTLKLWKFLKNEHNKQVDSVLEIGCGAGFISVWMSRFAKKVTSTDINKKALMIMQFNALLNNINNINPIYSDIYSNINQKYDVIISNPPYMFLPIKDKQRIYAYGGHLGLDILTKILIDLDGYLNYNGVAYFLTNSYIMENGTNTLIDLLEYIFYKQDYLITIKEILYQIPGSNSSFYKNEKISKAVLCCIKMEKGQKYKINRIQIRNVSKAIQYLKIKLLRD